MEELLIIGLESVADAVAVVGDLVVARRTEDEE